MNNRKNIKKILRWLFPAAIIIGIAGIFFLVRQFNNRTSYRVLRIIEWTRNPSPTEVYASWMVHAGQQNDEAPFIMPTDGYIGFLWDDTFYFGHRHSGIDIFAGTLPGVTPVIAAYDGYLTRLPEWTSSIIIRIPEDPLQPERQIWTYYTHMADSAGNSLISENFPPGTSEVYVKAGTILGYQGNYSGNIAKPTGLHLHFSIVKDNGNGNFLNELDIDNTLDPSPYFRLNLNANKNHDEIPVCQ